jgi:hypothetical protein
MLAPVCLFTYNRLAQTKETIEALKNNYLAVETELYIFSDGPKLQSDVLKIKEVRAYLATVSGFKKISISEHETNQGLANSIIRGVTTVINIFGKVIVLEDDLITSLNFLDYMNQALDYYEKTSRIFSISGFTFDLPALKKHKNDYYFGFRASSWGWATWKDRWEEIDWELNNYSSFISDRDAKLAFNKNRGSDMVSMLKNQMTGKIDSWAIRWCYHQFLEKSLTVFPCTSKIYNIGFGSKATHTANKGRFAHKLDTQQKRVFSFDVSLKIDAKIVKEFTSQFSVYQRIKWKLLSVIGI